MGVREDRKTGRRRGKHAQEHLNSFHLVLGATQQLQSQLRVRTTALNHPARADKRKDREAQKYDEPHGSHEEGSVLLSPLSFLAEERWL